jgi:hypothetical protein
VALVNPSNLGWTRLKVSIDNCVVQIHDYRTSPSVIHIAPPGEGAAVEEEPSTAACLFSLAAFDLRSLAAIDDISPAKQTKTSVNLQRKLNQNTYEDTKTGKIRSIQKQASISAALLQASSLLVSINDFFVKGTPDSSRTAFPSSSS